MKNIAYRRKYRFVEHLSFPQQVLNILTMACYRRSNPSRVVVYSFRIYPFSKISKRQCTLNKKCRSTKIIFFKIYVEEIEVLMHIPFK